MDNGPTPLGRLSRFRVWSRVQLRGCPFPSVLVSMVFGRFRGVVGRMECMPCSDFRMVRGLLMAAGFVMLRRLPMVFRCDLVMLSRLHVPCPSWHTSQCIGQVYREVRTEPSVIASRPRTESG
jgi:hypothetical protein